MKKQLLQLQHLFAMFGATILVPLLVGIDPQVQIFTAGVGTLIFHFSTKFQVPVFLGSSFQFIAPMTFVLTNYGIKQNNLAIVIVGLCYMIVQWIFAKFPQVLDKMLSPVVTGTIIIIIGLNLQPVAVNMISSNILLGILPIIIIQLIQLKYGNTLMGQLSILISIIISFFVALAFGLVDLSIVSKAKWLTIPNFQFGFEFNINAIIIIVPVMLSTLMEHLGDITTNGAVVGKNFVKEPGLHRTLVGDGQATLFSGLVGSVPNTTYSENTGVLSITKNYNPQILRYTAIFAIILSLIGKFSQLIQTIPQQIIGGISVILFGNIAVIGIRTLIQKQVDFTNFRNTIIVAIMLVVGIGAPTITIGSVTISNIALQTILGITLNIILKEEKE